MKSRWLSLWHLQHIRPFYNKSLVRNLHVLFIHQNVNSSGPSIERSTLQKVCESSNSISCLKFHIEKKCWGIINLDNHYSIKREPFKSSKFGQSIYYKPSWSSCYIEFFIFFLATFRFVRFRFASFGFVSFCLISVRYLRYISFRFELFRFVRFRFVLFRSVSFRFYFVSHFTGTRTDHRIIEISFTDLHLTSWSLFPVFSCCFSVAVIKKKT